MKRLSLLSLPVIALLALTPLPALAGGEGPKASSVPKPGDSSYRGFRGAQDFFAIWFQSGGNFIASIVYFHENSMIMGTPETEAEKAQREYMNWVVKERKRKEAERRARETEEERTRAENRADDDLPGLDY